MSLYFYDFDARRAERDTAVPFVSQMMVLQTDDRGVSSEIILPTRLAGLIGTNAKFVMHNDLATFPNGVIDVHNSANEFMLGYMYGGIEAIIPNVGPSHASRRLFKIHYRNKTTGLHETTNSSRVSVFPNPYSNEVTVAITGTLEQVVSIAVYELAHNRTHIRYDVELSSASSVLNEMLRPMPPGLRLVKMYNKDLFVTRRLIKLK